MAQGERSKEFWLIPKRANLHQAVYLVRGIVDLDYDGKSWNASKQDRLGSYLSKNGSTSNGRTITPQSIRTLLASIPQYFGLVFINTQTTPNSLYVSEAGYKILAELNSFFENYSYKKLSEAERNGEDLHYSKGFLHQFAKLQITNPVILKDCENIFIFPLIYLIKLLRKTGYLTFDEIAMFVFKSKSQDEIDYTGLQISSYRKMIFSDRIDLINSFKKTHLGNISLVQAPSVQYFEKLCRYTGLFKVEKREFPNPLNSSGIKTKSLVINPEIEEAANKILQEYGDNPMYDFRNNLPLWIEYFGNPKIKKTPQDINIFTSHEENVLVTINKNGKTINSDLISNDRVLVLPKFENIEYSIDIINPDDGSIFSRISIPVNEFNDIDVSKIERKTIDFNLDNTDTIITKILSHINSKSFDNEYAQYLKIIEKITGSNTLVDNKIIRGGYLEFLFYKLLTILLNNKILDELIWYGRTAEYGIPYPAPGGKSGKPDLLAFKDDLIFVFELTTIKSKTGQWNAEGASVPDHIRIIKEENPQKKVIGFYLAPLIHDRNTTAMKSTITGDYEIRCISIHEFLNNISIIKPLELFKIY